jgi:A/G-specific adenine glycosylase
MRVQTPDIVNFHRALTDYYYQSGRHGMPWRKPDKQGNFDPYKILVSEIMLQQTQVDRVIPKYHEFLELYPDITSLAKAKLGDVLRAWNGLGYNRRAKYLWEAARQIVHDHEGIFPMSPDDLKRLPGIGPNTAGAIMSYAFNTPVVYVETNIRTVVIHHFFHNKQSVDDKDIRAVLELLLPGDKKDDHARMQGAKLSPREFYWAMMDYGTYLKKTVGNLSRASKTYSKQSAFEGSLRQVRGAVIRLLTKGPHSRQELDAAVNDERLPAVLESLNTEALITEDNGKYRLS